MEVRIVTRVRRIIQATRYDLRSDVAAVPCSAEGNPRIREFRVSLYRTVGSAVPELYVCTKIRYRRSSGDVYTAWVDASDVSDISVPTGMSTGDKYDTFVIEAYHGDKMLTSLTVLTVLDGRIGNKGAQPRTRVWSKNDSYLQGKDDEQWYDISLYRDDDKSEYERYLCLVSHPPRNITPKDDVAQGLGFWGHATEYEFLATRLALAERIKADQIDADGITAKDVNITGHIEATSGTFSGAIKKRRIDINQLNYSDYFTQKNSAYYLNLDAAGLNINISGLLPFSVITLPTALSYSDDEDLQLAREYVGNIALIYNSTDNNIAISGVIGSNGETLQSVLLKPTHVAILECDMGNSETSPDTEKFEIIGWKCKFNKITKKIGL